MSNRNNIEIRVPIPAGFMRSYQAAGSKEKLAYRKGFEAAVSLLIECWGEESQESMKIRANTIMNILNGEAELK